MEKDELEMHEEFKTEVIDDDERDTGDVERGAEDDCVQPKASFDVIECDLDEENNPSKSQSADFLLSCKCGRLYKSLTWLKKHQCRSPKARTLVKKESRRKGEKKHICGYCAKAFHLKHDLIDHERTHTKEKPFLCDTCGMGFAQKSQLMIHRRARHSDTRPFSCRFCDRTFVQRIHCQNHERTHTGEKPFHCEECGKGFRTKTPLKAHLLLHTGEKPYKCPHCEKGYRTHWALTKHKEVHSGYVNPIAIYRYPCRHCELRFTSGHRRSKHEAQEHGVTDSKSQQKQPSQFDHHLALPLSINIS